METRMAVLEANMLSLKETFERLGNDVSWIKNLLVGIMMAGICLGVLQIAMNK
jgi:hypothetical protein